MVSEGSFKKISVVIPAFNEAQNFHRGVLDDVNNYLKKQNYKWEVILVNDGSTDDTLKLLTNFSKSHSGFKVEDIEHGGKVKAVMAGFKAASGDIILFSDFDQSVTIDNLKLVIEKFNQGTDVVIAYRKQISGWTFTQKLRSKIFNSLVQIIALPGIKDSQCGFKAFKADVGRKLFNNLLITQKSQKGGYMGAFDVELLYLARKVGYKISAIDVDWLYFESKRLSLTEPIKMIKDVISVRIADIKGSYDNLTGGKSNFWLYSLVPIIILILLIIPSFWDTLQPGYFPMHDDLQIMRQLVMDKCFHDGQIPCRWSVDLGYGYGYPMFNFYPPFPYYLGEIFRVISLPFTEIIKIIVILNLLISGIFMYLLTKNFWGRVGGIISGVAYVYAPYHAVDIYVRGAFNEAWALAWFPAVFLFIYKLIVTKQLRYIVFLALSTSFLLLSHNPMTMIFTPLAIIWAIFWVYITKNFKTFVYLIIAGVWGLGLAAFFTLPVLLEQQYVHIESLTEGYFNYLAHFVTVNELFISRFWGFGASEYGPKDGLSLQVGLFHWVSAVFSLGAALIVRKSNPKLFKMIILLFMLTIFYTFMNHEKSSFIWTLIKPLMYLQFPWRFLSISIFGTSFLAGSLVFYGKYLKFSWLKIFFSILLVTVIILLNQSYFKWKEHYPNITDQDKFSGKSWQLLITASIFDYLPIWSALPPADPPVGNATFVTGKGTYKTDYKNSIRQQYSINAQSGSIFEINTLYFPGWIYYLDGSEVSVNPYANSEVGLPQIKISQGDHTVLAILTDTPIRKWSNYVTLGSGFILIIFILFLILGKKKFNK